MSDPMTKEQRRMLAKMLGVKPKDIVLTPMVAAIHRVAISNSRAPVAARSAAPGTGQEGETP